MRVVLQELQIVFFMKSQRKWDSKGKQTHRIQDKVEASMSTALPQGNVNNQLHKFASAPPSQES